MSGLKYDFVRISPELAREWLAKAAPNRPLSDYSVAQIMRAFLDGTWKTNGDTIRFNQSGVLIDGRHRLTGFLAANKVNPALEYFDAAVVWEVPDDAMDTIDTGRRRNFRDHLNIIGNQNVHVLAALIRKLAYFANGMTDKTKLSIDECLGILSRHPKAVDSAKRCQPIAVAPRSTLGAIHYIGGIWGGDIDRANEWLDVFRTGTPDYNGCPAHRVREHFIRQKGEKRVNADNFKTQMLVWSWLNFRERKPTFQIRIPENVQLPGWTAEVCFGDSALLQTDATNLTARQTVAEIIGHNRSGSRYKKERQEIAAELEQERLDRLAKAQEREKKLKELGLSLDEY